MGAEFRVLEAIEADKGVSHIHSVPLYTGSAPSSGNGASKMPPNDRWSAFFSSPQFYVVSAAVAVLSAGAVMYNLLDEKIDSARLESKADVQTMELRFDARFDKVDHRFDKVDAQFNTLLNKIDSDLREVRSLIREQPGAKASHPG